MPKRNSSIEHIGNSQKQFDERIKNLYRIRVKLFMKRNNIQFFSDAVQLFELYSQRELNYSNTDEKPTIFYWSERNNIGYKLPSN